MSPQTLSDVTLRPRQILCHRLLLLHLCPLQCAMHGEDFMLLPGTVHPVGVAQSLAPLFSRPATASPLRPLDLAFDQSALVRATSTTSGSSGESLLCSYVPSGTGTVSLLR